jgi:lipopolysaccharide transport system ATP-binding protein
VLAVEVENVAKQFRRQTVQPSTTLKTAIVDFIHRRPRRDRDASFQALKDITLAVERGTTLGIIGRNGSGKSTLLKLLAGIYRPDSGKIAVHGKVGALLELGAGFHPEFSGRENIFINGIVLGLSKREVRQRFDEIVRFADLEAFIDEPVKTYSSGMFTRLGFSVAIHAEPDILLIDEILSVGDETFQKNCLDKLSEFRRRGKTIILVSHDLSAVDRWCDEALWMAEGTIHERGLPRRVIDLYRQSVAMQEGKAAVAEHSLIEGVVQQVPTAGTPNRWGSREIEIVTVRMQDVAGQEQYVYQSGGQARVVIQYKMHRCVEGPVFGMAILRNDGLRCYSSNTAIEELSLPSLGDGGEVEVFLDRLDLVAGTYYFDVAVHARDGYPYDYHHQLYAFTVESEFQDVGVFRIPHSWTFKPWIANPQQPLSLVHPSNGWRSHGRYENA